MKTRILSFLFAFYCVLTFADNDKGFSLLLELSLDKNQKLKATYSSDFNNNTSMHFAIIKNSFTKKFDVLSFHINNNEQVSQQETISLSSQPNIISFHQKDDLISIVNYDEKTKRLKVIDYDIVHKTAKVFNKEKILKPDHIFRVPDKTVLVYLNKTAKNSSIGTVTITNADNIAIDKITIPKEHLETYKTFFTQNVSPEAVNKNEFVAHGSINPKKIYFQNNELVITKDYRKIATTDVMKINLVSQQILVKEIKSKNVIHEIKSYNSFYDDENLFSIQLNKRDFTVNVFNANTAESRKSFSLQSDLLQKIDKSTLDIDGFMKDATKNHMKPTITINPSVDNSHYVLNIDKVNKNTYRYFHNWWWHHHWMMQEAMMMNHIQQNIPRFGPNIEMENYYYPFTAKGTSIKVILNHDFDFVDDTNFKSKYPEIDKKENVKTFEDNSAYKSFTASFTDKKIRYIYYSKSKKKILIYSKPVKK